VLALGTEELGRKQHEPIRTTMKRLYFALRIAAFLGLIALCLTGQTKKHENVRRDEAALIDFVTPGLVITINSAKISSGGVISVTYTLADPDGLPLDATGATTPGQEQYVAYTTQRTGKWRQVAVTV
jgi:hypothetical protein